MLVGKHLEKDVEIFKKVMRLKIIINLNIL